MAEHAKSRNPGLRYIWVLLVLSSLHFNTIYRQLYNYVEQKRLELNSGFRWLILYHYVLLTTEKSGAVDFR